MDYDAECGPMVRLKPLLEGERHGGAEVNAAKTHCKRGHPFSGDNLRIVKGDNGKPQRICKECARLRWLRERYKRRPVSPPLYGPI